MDLIPQAYENKTVEAKKRCILFMGCSITPDMPMSMGTDLAFHSLMKSFVYLSLFVALGAGAIDRQTESELSLAHTAAKLGKYPEAILKLQPLLDQLKLDTVEAITLGNKILAVSYCETGDIEKAKENRQSLEAFTPHEKYEEFDLSKPCLEFFGLKRPVKKKPVELPPPSVPEKLLPKKLPWQVSMPLGTGQFYNDQREKGWAFLSTQAFGIAAMIATFTLFQAEKNGDGTFANTGKAHGLKAAFWSSVGITSGAALWGIFDARSVQRKKLDASP